MTSSSGTSSMSSPELQAEFLQKRRNKFASLCDSDDSSVFSATPPSSPDPSPASSSSSSPCPNRRQSEYIAPSAGEKRDRRTRMSLSSPELLSELKESRTRTLRHVPVHTGLTTVFSGRGGQGRQPCGPTHSARPANQRTLH